MHLLFLFYTVNTTEVNAMHWYHIQIKAWKYTLYNEKLLKLFIYSFKRY